MSKQDIAIDDAFSIECETVRLGSPSSESGEANQTPPESGVKKIMKEIIGTAVGVLNEQERSKFCSFGKNCKETVNPMILTTLCSGTDGAVDLLKAIQGMNEQTSSVVFCFQFPVFPIF